MDVFPTFFDWAGLQMPTDIVGRSLLPVLAGDRTETVVESELFLTSGEPDHLRAHKLSLSNTTWRFLIDYDTKSGKIRERLYRIEVDPQEQDDLAHEGIVSGVDLPDALCEAIDKARRLIWDAAEQDVRLTKAGYRNGPLELASRRPAKCAE